MINWLTVVRIRCGVILFHWHQRLPIINSLSALTIIIATAVAFDSLTPKAFPWDLSSSFVNNVDNIASSSLTRLDNRPKNTSGTEPPTNPAFPPLASSQELFSTLQGAYVTEAVSSPNLGVTLTPRLPDNLANLSGEERKKLFIDLLLPTVMIALEEVKQERQQLLTIIAELDIQSQEVMFSGNDLSWQHQIGADKTKFILGLTQKYRTEDVAKLLAKINVLPPSLIIAQGALESGWGSSRFATEVNNLFGMYASMKSSSSSAMNGSNPPKIIAYASILDSVRSYILNINRLSAYRQLRQIRSQTLDSMLIADGLTRYSERKEYYIADVKEIITNNNLQHFDSFILDAVELTPSAT